MSISYSAIQGRKGVTLPSWDQVNILRDPPRSITTYRKDRVGQTSLITDWIDSDAAGDRICEVIKPFARGVDYMKTVDYSNNGTNGGLRRYPGNVNSTSGLNFGNRQAFLPYRVARDGAFRPPVIGPRELLPLSRLPRTTTDAYTNPSFPNFAKRLDNSCDVRQIRKEVLTTCVRPTAIYNVEMPTDVSNANAAYNLSSAIQNPIKTDVQTGVRFLDWSENTSGNSKQKSSINESRERYSAGTNISDSKIYKNINGEFNTNKYVQDIEHFSSTSANTNISDNSRVTLLDGNEEMILPIKDRMNYDYQTPLRGEPIDMILSDEVDLCQKTTAYDINSNVSQDIYIRQVPDNYRELERNVPLSEMYTNYSDNRVDLNNEVLSRDYHLPPRSNRGGFSNGGTLPGDYSRGYEVQEMGHLNHTYDPNKIKLQERINTMREGRITAPYMD